VAAGGRQRDVLRGARGELQQPERDDPKRLEADPRLSEELDYCAPRGISHSHFLGGPDAWTDDDRDKALAWADRDRRTHVCGTRREEWDPAQGGRRDAYEFLPAVCPGCEALERAQAVMGGAEWQGQRGKTILVRRKPPPPVASA
jgi:hypothetical protein